jgi:hypothetical protein
MLYTSSPNTDEVDIFRTTGMNRGRKQAGLAATNVGAGELHLRTEYIRRCIETRCDEHALPKYNLAAKRKSRTNLKRSWETEKENTTHFNNQDIFRFREQHHAVDTDCHQGLGA